MLHPRFRLDGKSFSSTLDLKEFASIWVNNDNNYKKSIGAFILEWLDDKDSISVQTSGSTGIPKLIKLQKKHIYNSAAATVSYFNLHSGIKALHCLPSEYIAGKMMLVRAMIAGWDLYSTAPGKNPLHQIDLDFDFSAMVPYQVNYSMGELNRVKKLIVGGGAVSQDLENQLQSLNTEVYATYGMTETISHIAVRRINGINKSYLYSALPNVRFSQTEEGCLQIFAPEISREPVITNDVVNLISPSSFQLLGRIDNVINSGGVKIHPESVENKIGPFMEQSFFIASEIDEILGERVILVLESGKSMDLEYFSEIFKVLSKYEIPKKVVSTPQFVFTDTGKIRRMETLKKMAPIP